ncbi:MAG: hypothetical protein ACKO1N_06380 [Erythrobacter sp.]
MNHAIALSLSAVSRIDSVELARRVIVLGSALALILAGQAFPV